MMPIKIKEDNRRFLLINCSNELCGKQHQKYFNDLHLDLEPQNVISFIRTIYDYFTDQNLFGDMDKFKNLKISSTDYSSDILQSQWSKISKFIEFYAKKKYENDIIFENEIDIELLYAEYYSWCRKTLVKSKDFVEKEEFSLSLFNENISGIEKLKIKKFTLRNLTL